MAIREHIDVFMLTGSGSLPKQYILGIGRMLNEIYHTELLSAL
jgi:hypothetical protein